jgi:hypothetical protein
MVVTACFTIYIMTPIKKVRVIKQDSLQKLVYGHSFGEVVEVLQLKPGDYTTQSVSISNPPYLNLGTWNHDGNRRTEIWKDDYIHLWVQFKEDGTLSAANAVGQSTGKFRESIRNILFGRDKD